MTKIEVINTTNFDFEALNKMLQGSSKNKQVKVVSKKNLSFYQNKELKELIEKLKKDLQIKYDDSFFEKLINQEKFNLELENSTLKRNFLTAFKSNSSQLKKFDEYLFNNINSSLIDDNNTSSFEEFKDDIDSTNLIKSMHILDSERCLTVENQNLHYTKSDDIGVKNTNKDFMNVYLKIIEDSLYELDFDLTEPTEYKMNYEDEYFNKFHQDLRKIKSDSVFKIKKNVNIDIEVLNKFKNEFEDYKNKIDDDDLKLIQRNNKLIELLSSTINELKRNYQNDKKKGIKNLDSNKFVLSELNNTIKKLNEKNLISKKYKDFIIYKLENINLYQTAVTNNQVKLQESIKVELDILNNHLFDFKKFYKKNKVDKKEVCNKILFLKLQVRIAAIKINKIITKYKKDN